MAPLWHAGRMLFASVTLEPSTTASPGHCGCRMLLHGSAEERWHRSRRRADSSGPNATFHLLDTWSKTSFHGSAWGTTPIFSQRGVPAPSSRRWLRMPGQLGRPQSLSKRSLGKRSPDAALLKGDGPAMACVWMVPRVATWRVRKQDRGGGHINQT